jgi:ubiquinone/menaquinone biosynthesis C-methylase UbiE
VDANSIRRWNRDADGYNRWVLRSLHSAGYRAPFEELLRRTFGEMPRRILDAGTGPGIMAFLLAGMGHRVTAIDLSEGMLRQARANAALLDLDVEFQQGDAENLIFPDGTFDGLVSRLVLWNLPNPRRALAEWCRVLRPGGVLLIIDVDMGETRRNWWWRKPWHIASAPLVLLTEGRNPLKNRTTAAALDRLPLTRERRPGWEFAELQRLGFEALEIGSIRRSAAGWMEFLKYGCWGTYVSVSGRKAG